MNGNSPFRCSLRIVLLASTAMLASCQDPPAVVGEREFVFSDWSGPPVPVRLYVPASAGRDTAIVFVMHGASRDAVRYFRDWRAQGERRGFVVVVPEFSREDFPKSTRYNNGHVFDPQTTAMRPEALWTFSVIEPLFDHVVGLLDGAQAEYTLFGHSAGAQFLHRFLYYKPEARVKRAIAANAGWYTLPDFGIEYPYGLQDSGVDESSLVAMLGRDLIILLGDRDTDENAEQLRKTPEAEVQGPHRLARGQTMFRVARARAAQLDVEFNWRLEIVEGAGHVNAEMTPAAAFLVR